MRRVTSRPQRLSLEIDSTLNMESAAVNDLKWGICRQMIELHSVHAPSPDVKLKLLKEIAEEHGLDWDPAASETESFKPHEDLPNGQSSNIFCLSLLQINSFKSKFVYNLLEFSIYHYFK